jgi:hypothetical protein
MLEKQGFITGDCLQMPHDLQADVVLPIIKYVTLLLSLVYVLLRPKLAKNSLSSNTQSLLLSLQKTRMTQLDSLPRQHLDLVF